MQSPHWRDEFAATVSNKQMNQDATGDKINFTLSESAEAYLRKILPSAVDHMSKRGIVPILSHRGGGTAKKDGKVTWHYRGPAFALAGQKPEFLNDGKYYNLFGCSIWIEELENIMLKGHVLTMQKVGSPEPLSFLVIQNAPENYFQQALDEMLGGAACCSCKPHVTSQTSNGDLPEKTDAGLAG
jgi:hypothetical protein